MLEDTFSEIMKNRKAEIKNQRKRIKTEVNKKGGLFIV
jgi:hypothetical protein